MASQSTMPHACDLIENNPEQLDYLTFQAGFLPMLGVSPILGRNFLPEEDRPHGPNVAILSYGLWSGHYNRDPGIIGRAINIDGNQTRVVGVLPKDFQFPTLQAADIIFPMVLNRADQATANGGFGYPMRTFARLRPDVTIAQAREMMEPLFENTRDTVIPADVRADIHLSIRSVRDRETDDVQLAAWVLLGAVLAVLLIACANVASLMMVRGEARERELAVRSALGASRARLVRQTLTEATLLALAGAAMGMALGQGLLRAFVSLAPTGIPFLERTKLDLRIAAFSVLLSLVCGVVFGLLAALQTPRMMALAARTAKMRRRTVLRGAMVVGQIAVSMVLLTGAALLLKSFRNVEEQNLGIQSGGVFTAEIALPGFRYNTPQKQMQFYLDAEAAIRRLPGIRAVAFSDSVPPGGWQGGWRLSGWKVDGKPLQGTSASDTLVDRKVTPEYFSALNIPIVRGRAFDETDARLPDRPVILSRMLAARLFPGGDAIGRTVNDQAVIGIAENVKNGGLVTPDEPELYTLRGNTEKDWEGRKPVMIIGSVLSAQVVAPWVKAQIAAIDPTVPVKVEALDQTVSKLADRPRFETALLGFFALCGLLMAVIGLYGVISFLATQRTQEIGVRMALGATRGNILRLIAREGVRLILLGGLVGLVAALLSARLLQSMLYHVGVHDPGTYVTVGLLLAGVALIATLIPARTAMKVEPVEALRYE